MKQILLVEDDPFLADIYTTKLGEQGFEIEVADDGKQAWTKLKEQSPDLLVLDIVLPHIDGWDILKRIKQDPELKNLRIVVLSNLGEKSQVERGRRLGADKYLIKSKYTPSEVVEEIKKLMNHDT